MDAEQLGILGDALFFLGDGLVLLASEKEASLDKIKDKKEKEEESLTVTKLNICGNFITLLGDTTGLIAIQIEAEPVLANPDKVDKITLEATRENLIGEQLIVLGDVFNYRAAVLISQVS